MAGDGGLTTDKVPPSLDAYHLLELKVCARGTSGARIILLLVENDSWIIMIKKGGRKSTPCSGPFPHVQAVAPHASPCRPRRQLDRLRRGRNIPRLWQRRRRSTHGEAE